jgi:hypothetical protein
MEKVKFILIIQLICFVNTAICHLAFILLGIDVTFDIYWIMSLIVLASTLLIIYVVHPLVEIFLGQNIDNRL